MFLGTDPPLLITRSPKLCWSRCSIEWGVENMSPKKGTEAQIENTSVLKIFYINSLKLLHAVSLDILVFETF